jgi:hypothetical protein
MSAEELARQAAERVREVVVAAERKAEQIVREAEQEAAEIKQRAENEAREKLERARQTLSDLVGETPGPDPAPTPQPPTPMPEPTPDPTPEPSPEPIPEPQPPAAEAPEAGQTATDSGADHDEAAERLIAMKLAVDGKDREEIEAELESKFGPGDRSALLDIVLSRAGSSA